MTTTREILDHDPFGKGIMETMFQDQTGEKPTLESKGEPYWFLAEWREARIKSESRLAAVPGLDGKPVIWHEKDVAKRDFAARYGNKPYLLMQAHEGRNTCFVEQTGSRPARPATLVNVPAVVESLIREVRTHTDGERKDTQKEWPKLTTVRRAKKGKKDGKNIWFIKGERKGTIVYWKRTADGTATRDYMDGKKKWWGADLEDIEVISESSAIHWRDIDEHAHVVREDNEDGVAYFADGVPVFWYEHENLATVHLDKIAEAKVTRDIPMKQRIGMLADAWYDGNPQGEKPTDYGFTEAQGKTLQEMREKHGQKREFLKAAQVALDGNDDAYASNESKPLSEALNRSCLLDVAEAMQVTESNLTDISEEEFRQMAENAAIKARLVTIYRHCYQRTGLQEARQRITFDPDRRQYTMTIQRENLIGEAEEALDALTGASVERTEADGSITFAVTVGEAKKTEDGAKALLKDVVALLNHKPRYTSGDADSYDVAAEIDKCLKDGKKDSPSLWKRIQTLLNAAPRFTAGDLDSYKVAARVDKHLAKNKSINEGKVTEPMKTLNESVADLAQRKNLKDIVRAAITSVGTCPCSKKELEESNTVVIDIPNEGQTVVHAEVWDRGKDKIMSEHPDAIIHDGRLIGEGREFDPFTKKNPKSKFDPFVAGYIAAALFTVGEDEAEELGKTTHDVNVDDLAPEAIKKMTKVAKDFWKKYEDTIEEAGLDPFRAGNLLYYAHSGAGVTWLDDDDNEALQKLDKAPEAQHYASPYSLYVGDDGKLYRESEEAGNDLASLLDAAGLKPTNEGQSLIKRLLDQGHNRCALTNEALTPETTVVVTIPEKGRFVMHAEAFDEKRGSLSKSAQIVDGRSVFSEGAKKKTIRKEFKSLKQAESYQNRLYNQWDSVKLIQSPRFEESGVYVWEVSNKDLKENAGRVISETSYEAKDEDQADKNFDKWEEAYKPQKNHLNDNAGYNGWLYETYGEEVKFVQELAKKEPNRVWTLLEGDEGMWISSGYHHVNRIGYFVTEKPCKKDCEYQIEVYAEEEMDESALSTGIVGSSDLGKKLHQWHSSDDDAVYQVGSKFVAGKKATKKECLAAAKILKETDDTEAQALGQKLREMCGVTNATSEGLAKLAHAIAETTAAWNEYQVIESRREMLGEKVTHTARQMGGGIRTYGLTIKAQNEGIIAEACSDTGNQLFPFVPFDESIHTNNANEFAKASEAADKAADAYDKLYKRTEDIAESLALESGTHDTPLGVIEISPEGNMRLTYVKSESFAVDEDNPVRSWMLTKPFREYAEGMMDIAGQQFGKASVRAHEAVKKAGGRIDFGGFAIATEGSGVALYGQGKGARPFLENVANGTISVADPIREWAQTVLLRQTFKVTVENLKDIEDRSRAIVLDNLPESAVASIAFDGRECGTLYKRGERSVFVDAHSPDRVFGSKPMKEAEANAILAWSRLHDIDEPESLEEQAVYAEQLEMYNSLVAKIGESQEYFCFLNDDGVMIEVLKDGDEICGARAEGVTHKVTNTGMEVTETKDSNEPKGNKAFSEDGEVTVDLSAAQLTLELRSAIKDMNSGLVEKAGAAAANVGNIAHSTIKAWAEKLGGTYQESGDADIFEGATSITDTITRSWVLLDQAKDNYKKNESVFNTPYGEKLGTMLDEALTSFVTTVESFYTPQSWSQENQLDEQLVAEAAVDLEALFGNFADLVESTAILEPSALKMQAASMARIMEKMNKGAGPKTPMKTETQKYALKTAHGIVSMAHALIRSLGKNSGEAKQALARMEKDPLFKEWKGQLGKKMNPQGSITLASEEVKAIRSGLNAATRQLSRISGEGVDEMKEAILAARKVVNKIGVDVSMKNLNSPGEQETHFEAKKAPKPKVSVETLPEDQQATVKEYLRLQEKIKNLKKEMEALESDQKPSKESVIGILEEVDANLEDAEGAVISLRKQPGKILYNKVIEQALKRVNEATRNIIEKLMESTRGQDIKYPVVTNKKKNEAMQTEGVLSGLASMGKKAMDALVKALRGYNRDLKDAVEQLQAAAKNARMGIVTEIASRNPKDDGSGESDLSPDSGLADKDGRREMGASREKPGTTKPKSDDVHETWPQDGATGKPDFKPSPVGQHKNKRDPRPEDDASYDRELKPKPDDVQGKGKRKVDSPEFYGGSDPKQPVSEDLMNEDPAYSGELRTDPEAGLANQTGNDDKADSPYEPEGSVKRDDKKPEVGGTK